MIRLSKNQGLVLNRLAVAELKAAMGEDAIEKVRKDIEEIRNWGIYQDSKEPINKSIVALKKYNLLQAAGKAFRTDCSQCIHVGSCEYREVRDICFGYLSDSPDFNELGQDEAKIIVYEKLIKEIFK